jgi:hypothetical protein
MVGMSNDDGVQLGTTDHMAGSDVTARGYLTGPGLVEFPVEYAVVDGRAIHEGCIDMGPAEQVAAAAVEIAARREIRQTTVFAGSTAGEDGVRPGGDARGTGLPGTSQFLWTDGRVAYSVDADVPDQGRVTDAIRHIEDNTGIRFTRRTSANAASLPNWIQVISNGNQTFSSSAIGMRGGRQDLRLADGHGWGVLVHEFLHALGVYHEQSRSDRDDFVDIKWDNIKDGPPPAGEINALGNFQKKPDAVDYYGYDYGSIMHYPRTSFAKDSSKPTIEPRRSGVTIGQRNGMSFGDRQTVAKVYERFFAKGYAGVWRQGSGRYALWVNADWADFAAKWQQWSGEGLRLVDIHVRPTSAGLRYSGVFLPGSGGHGLWVNAPWESFVAKWQEWSGQGLRLHDVHVHHEGGQNRYSGAFLPGGGGYGLWANAGWDGFRAKWQEWSGQGLRLHDVHVHNLAGEDRFTGVFLAGTGGHGLWANTSWASFAAKWQEWSGQGLRLVDLNVHRSGSETRFTGAFLPGTDRHALWANVTWESFRAKVQEWGGEGLRLVDFEFVNPPAGALLDGTDAGAEYLAAEDEVLEPFGGVFGVEPAVAPAGADLMGGVGGLGGLGPAPVPAAVGGSGSAYGNVVIEPRRAMESLTTDAAGTGGALVGSAAGPSVETGGGGATTEER